MLIMCLSAVHFIQQITMDRSSYDVMIPLLPEAFLNSFCYSNVLTPESTKIMGRIRVTKETTKRILVVVVS
jgi:hypothetical protein